MPILSAKRQVTLPKELCDRLAVEPGDDLEIVEHNGHITILKKQRGRSAGVLKYIGTDPRFSDEDSRQSAIEARGQTIRSRMVPKDTSSRRK
jgi:AbrB family looped-hinge helix DNA binding protein